MILITIHVTNIKNINIFGSFYLNNIPFQPNKPQTSPHISQFRYKQRRKLATFKIATFKHRAIFKTNFLLCISAYDNTHTILLSTFSDHYQ